MTFFDFIKNNRHMLRQYVIRGIMIAILWILFDYSSFSVFSFTENIADYPFADSTQNEKVLRLILSFTGYFLIAYALIFPLAVRLRRQPLWLAFIIKLLILSVLAWLLASINFFFTYYFIKDIDLQKTLSFYQYYTFDKSWMTNFIMLRFLMFLATLFGLEIADKYSPGVFLMIFFGRYNKPREENRIIIFLDLINSTPIAEQLGHKRYFLFIRDFIHHISTALLEYRGLIYQYVGDEIVVSWILNEKNKKNSLASLRRAQQIIEKESSCYMREYGVRPEFRAGVHCGMVTVGEIGIVKKDLAISGDAMNTTARIRSMTGTLNIPVLASADFIHAMHMRPEEIQSVGFFDLKGKSAQMELFCVLNKRTN